MLDLTEGAIDDAIDELEDAQVFEPWGVEDWRFRHELLREVAAEFAPPSVACGLHARVADVMVERGGDDADWPLVGAHYEQGERFAEAMTAYRTAAPEHVGAAHSPRPGLISPRRSTSCTAYLPVMGVIDWNAV